MTWARGMTPWTTLVIISVRSSSLQHPWKANVVAYACDFCISILSWEVETEKPLGACRPSSLACAWANSRDLVSNRA